jgi:hypothetical protein
VRREAGAIPKGLTTKYAIRLPHEECVKLEAFKIEYAQGEDGRTWRRIHRKGGRFRGYNSLRFTEVTRWHIAAPYEWFPALSPEEVQKARKQNQLARVPKGLDVYLIKGRYEIVLRPQPEPPPAKKRGRPRKGTKQ